MNSKLLSSLCLRHCRFRMSSSITLLKDGYEPSAEPFYPRRACLYVPGNDKKKLSKIETVQADSFILDCEDGVAINKKVQVKNIMQHV